ncbi:MAG: MCE family protein [Gammaproteobacteria bacterium]|nr:MCE family protein [Gammaproteobacteria bacterium]
MDEGKRHYRLGLFVVVSIIALAVLLFVLGGKKLFQPTYTFESYFAESVAGLEVGSPLRYRGVPLGQVSEIVDSAAEYERDVPLAKRRNYIVVRAKVTLSAVEALQVKRDAPELVKLGLRAQTQLAGITGQQYLALDYLDPAKHRPLEFGWTPKYEYVPSAPSRTGEIIAKAQVFAAKLSELDVQKLDADLNRLLVNLNDKVGELPVATLSADADNLLRNANTTIVSAKPLVVDLKQSVDNLAVITRSLRGVADRGDLDRTITHIDEGIERLNGLLGDNRYDLRVIVRDLRVTADNLRELSATIKRYPAGALIGGPPEKVRLPVEK